MNIMDVAIAAAILGAVGLVVGILLGVAGKAFAVEVDEKEESIRELLPGNNCGGCGFAGCDAFAKALAKGEADLDDCPVTSQDKRKEIGKTLGVDTKDKEREVAFVRCAGTCDKTKVKYRYHGIPDCKKLDLIPGHGQKSCIYGCMGFGSCVRVCVFNAIYVKDGVAIVDSKKCTACGQCIKACPRNLIVKVPESAVIQVLCSSTEKGKMVKSVCDIGCIGCGICVKQCEVDAILLEDNVARIDPSKCTKCGKCITKCPVKIIRETDLKP